MCPTTTTYGVTCLPHDRPTVYNNHLSRDIIGPVAGQKKYRADQIFGLTDSPDRNFRSLSVKLRFTFYVRFGLRCIDRSRADTVDGNAMRRKLERQRFGKADDAAL